MTNQSTPRVAVVGAGYWGINHVRNFYEIGALGLVCDTYAPTTARSKTQGFAASSLRRPLKPITDWRGALSKPAKMCWSKSR
jgi:cell division GTPase FtsZ